MDKIIQVLSHHVEQAIQAEAESLKVLGRPRGEVVERFHADAAAISSADGLSEFWQLPTLTERYATEHSLPPDATALRVAKGGTLAAFALAQYRPAMPLRERHLPPVHVAFPLICTDGEGRGVVATALGSMQARSVFRQALAEFYGLAEVGLVWVQPSELRDWLKELGSPDFNPSRTQRPPPAEAAGRNGYLPHLTLDGFRLPMDRPDWVQLAPRLLTTFQALPVFVSTQMITLAVPPSTPTNKRDELSNLLHGDSRAVRFVFAQNAALERLMGDVSTLAVQTLAAEKSSRITSVARSNEQLVEDIDIDGMQNPDAVGDEETAIPIVRAIIAAGIHRKASDITVLDATESLVVRYRCMGEWSTDRTPYAASSARQVVARLKMLATGDTTQRRRPSDGSVRVRHRRGDTETNVRLRFTCVMSVLGEEITLRIIYSNAIPLMGELGMPARVEKYLRRMILSDRGLFVITGPTGSGKSSTMAALIDTIDRERRRVLTFESPVEFELPGCVQTDIPEDMVEDRNSPNYVDWGMLVRNALRRAPDVIFCGETRDQETVLPLLQAAGTGHLALTTVHTNSSTDVVLRFLGLGANPSLFAHAFRGALAQRLVKLVCPHCCEKASVTPDLMDLYGLEANYFDGVREVITSQSDQGCHNCVKGFIGRQAIFELCAIETREDKRAIDEGILALVHGSAQGGSSIVTRLEERMKAKGMPTLREQARELVIQQKISLSAMVALTDLI